VISHRNNNLQRNVGYCRTVVKTLSIGLQKLKAFVDYLGLSSESNSPVYCTFPFKIASRNRPDVRSSYSLLCIVVGMQVREKLRESWRELARIFISRLLLLTLLNHNISELHHCRQIRIRYVSIIIFVEKRKILNDHEIRDESTRISSLRAA
jgi:hypothetical protein